MWGYEKKLQYPINIKNPNPQMAKFIISQYGGPDGELGAALRYLSQRFSMPTEIAKATLNDVGTEELGHLEMVGTLVNQLTKGATPEQMKRAGLGDYYTDHGISVYPQAAAGYPYMAASMQVKGDPVTDLYEDLAAEQKARSTYEYLIDLSDDPDVTNVLRFLREREVVHFQRFGEALRTVQEKLAQKKFYMNTNRLGTVATTVGGNVIIGGNNDDSITNSCGCNTNVELGNMNTCSNQMNRNRN